MHFLINLSYYSFTNFIIAPQLLSLLGAKKYALNLPLPIVLFGNEDEAVLIYFNNIYLTEEFRKPNLAQSSAKKLSIFLKLTIYLQFQGYLLLFYWEKEN